MGKKKGNRGKGQQKEKTVISLFEFNQNATVGQSTPAGFDRDAAALPSAPKAAEEWEAEGGRPEYDSRGYKERRVEGFADGGVDDAEFDQRDWSRRGPVDGPDSEFGTGPERDWQKGRTGPLDADDTGVDRDWGGMRRGPVDAEAPGGGVARNDDWGAARRGPVEAELPGGAARNDDWGAARRTGPTEAVFEDRPQQDWTARKGPVDAIEPTAASAPENWAGARKGPVDAIVAESTERDWTARKGPVEAEAPAGAREVNFSEMRRGAKVLPDEPAVAPPRDVNFSEMRRGAKVLPDEPAAAPPRDVNFSDMRRGTKFVSEEPAAPPAREVDFAGMRRGAKVMPDPPARAEGETRAGLGRGSSWRRSKPMENAPGAERVTTELARMNVQSSASAPAPAPSRDWGSARRGQPLADSRRAGRPDADPGFAAARRAPPPEPSRIQITQDPTGEWTTVRTGERRRPFRRPFSREASVPAEVEKINAVPVVAAKAEDAASSIA